MVENSCLSKIAGETVVCSFLVHLGLIGPASSDIVQFMDCFSVLYMLPLFSIKPPEDVEYNAFPLVFIMINLPKALSLSGIHFDVFLKDLFIFGYAGSSLLHVGFIQSQRAEVTLCYGAQASHCISGQTLTH